MQLSKNEVEGLLELAGMAPSGGNMQCWRVHVRPGSLELTLALERTGTLLDVGCSASIFSLGSFLENLCLASAAAGLDHEVQLGDFRTPADIVVRVTYLGRSDVLQKDPLHAQIALRHTNRHLHVGPPLSEGTLDALRRVTERWPALRLSAVADLDAKKAAATAFGKGNGLLFRHRQLFEQMMNEVRWSRAEAERSRDGVAVGTLELPAPAVSLLRLLRRWPALRMLLPRAALESMPRSAVMGCSHLCALAVRDLSPASLLEAGRAAQRIWLQASALDLGIQPLATLPFLVLRAEQFGGEALSSAEVSELRTLGRSLKQLFRLREQEFPLFTFRLFRPAAPASERALRLAPAPIHVRMGPADGGQPS